MTKTTLCDPAPGAMAASSHTVVLEPHRWSFQADSGESLFEAARRAGIRLPTLCRNGTCRACFSRLISGSVSYRVEWPGLSSQEKQEGYVLPCVAIALSPLVVEAPLAEKISD